MPIRPALGDCNESGAALVRILQRPVKTAFRTRSYSLNDKPHGPACNRSEAFYPQQAAELHCFPQAEQELFAIFDFGQFHDCRFEFAMVMVGFVFIFAVMIAVAATAGAGGGIIFRCCAYPENHNGVDCAQSGGKNRNSGPYLLPNR